MTPSPAFDFASRVAAARSRMVELGVDVLLASVGADLPYLFGYEAMPSERLTMGVIGRQGPAVLVIPQLEAPRVQRRPDVFDVRAWPETEDPVSVVAALAGDARRVAVTDRTWSVFLLGLQAALPSAAFCSAAPVVGPLRLVKDDFEAEFLGRAAEAADRVAVRLAAERFSGRTEEAMARRVGAMLVEEGCDAVSFVIVASGPNSASPHHHPGDRVMHPGDAVVVDFGGPVAGYQSDTTRTFHIGEPTARYLEVHDVVRRAQRAGREAVAPGVAAADIDAAARRVIADAGYGEWFIHRLGHGIGLEVHEEPYLVSSNNRPLQPGMAFSVEPGVYLPGEFGVRIEDIVVCGERGAVPLNTSPRDVIVVG